MKGSVGFMLGKNHTIESRKKMSISRTGDKNHFFGKHHSDESKEKMSLSLQGRVSSMKGKHLSDERKEQISKRMKGKFSGSKNPAYNNKMYAFFHNDYGVKIGTIYNLYSNFNITRQELCMLISKRRTKAKGWTLFKDKIENHNLFNYVF